MREDHLYSVYILANRSRRLYIGVTNGLLKRVGQHRRGHFDGFTKTYNIYRLVYFERFSYINNAIAREKQLKGWLREKKLAIINAANPSWIDLYEELLFDPVASPWLAFNRIGAPDDKRILRCAQDDNAAEEKEDQ